MKCPIWSTKLNNVILKILKVRLIKQMKIYWTHGNQFFYQKIKETNSSYHILKFKIILIAGHGGAHL